MCYFKKSKNKSKARKGNKGHKGGGGNGNSRQRRKARRESISEAQRLAIVNAVLSKKRLLIYADSL
jgi:hypothetical protein